MAFAPGQHRPTAITIGAFDGVHAGHAALIRAARDAVGPDGWVIAAAFFPHPAAVLRPGHAPSLLTAWDARERLLQSLGADEVRRLDPASGILDLTAEAFLRGLVADTHPVAIVEGADFRFGKARGGDVEVLRALGAAMGFRAVIVDDVRIALSDGVEAAASSTLVRWLLQHGRVRDAAIALGRPYTLEGVATQGARRGRQIGMPTVNLASCCLAPADGVYAGWVAVPDAGRIPAAISVGTNPTFGGGLRTVEAHLIGWRPASGPGSPAHEYGWPVAFEFRHWLRDQGAFGSVDALMDQMRRDLARALELLGVRGTTEDALCTR